MRSGVLISTIYLLSTLHLGASFYFLRHQERIETLYVTSRDMREDWACALSAETKIAICKELLASHFFSKILQLDYNKDYERKGHKFECERRPVWLVSKEHVYTKRFRGFQRMIMCPVCSKYSEICYVVNGVETAAVDRQTFTRRTFDNDKKKVKMSFEEMVDSRDAFDYESREYVDADDIFITSQQTHYTDATEQFHSSQMSSSIELFDSEQRAESGQRLLVGFNPVFGRLNTADTSDGGNFDTRFDTDTDIDYAERGSDFSRPRVIPEETAVDDTRDTDVDQLVSASRPAAVITPLNVWHRVQLWPQVNTETSDVEKTVDTKPLGADRLDDPAIRVASSPNDRPAEQRRIAAERNIESLVRTRKETEQSAVSEKIANFKREISPHVLPNTDLGHLVHSVGRPNDDSEQSVSHRRVHHVDLGQRDHAGQPRDTEEKADGLQNFTPQREIVAEMIPAGEKDVRIDQRVRFGQPSDAEEKPNSAMKFEAEQKLLARKAGSAEASLATGRGPRNDVVEEESNKSDKKEGVGRNERFLEKVDAAEDARRYANPEEELEEYYFSIDPGRPQSVFLYTWFKTGGYFTIYMHIIKLQTPIPKLQVARPKVGVPFDTWTGPLHARPIRPYEPYEFLDETEKGKVPSPVKKSNKLTEMTQFAGGD